MTKVLVCSVRCALAKKVYPKIDNEITTTIEFNISEILRSIFVTIRLLPLVDNDENLAIELRLATSHNAQIRIGSHESIVFLVASKLPVSTPLYIRPTIPRASDIWWVNRGCIVRHHAMLPRSWCLLVLVSQ